MSKYTVAVLKDGTTERTCGHNHQTAAAAEACRLRLTKDARFYGAKILKDGRTPNGIGMWEDG
ncbi:MAG TPA: hypothetical protein PK406_08185 [Verrucomicrobiota bacterium]|nr:hypothetical protein [Verrucomicrobiota bacterium]